MFVEAAQELFSRVITEASQVDNGDILFASLKTDKGKDIIELLVKVNIIERHGLYMGGVLSKSVHSYRMSLNIRRQRSAKERLI